MKKGVKSHKFVHGMGKTKEYATWRDMIQRCTNKNSNNYKYYGAVGITVCVEWRLSFKNFYRDMGDRPSDNHSLDRIDVKGHYCKENCRWATRYVQDRNTKRSRWLSMGDKTMVLKDWAKFFNMHQAALTGYLKMHTWEEAYSRYTNPELIEWRKRFTQTQKENKKLGIKSRGEDGKYTVEYKELQRQKRMK